MDAIPRTIEELDEILSRPTPEVIDVIRDSPGTFLVLGAGGKMGYHVARMLQRALAACGRETADRSEPVTTVSRFTLTKTREQFEREGFRVVCADASDPRQVARLPDADHVFFLAGVKFGTSHQPELLERMNVRMPALVADRYRSSRIVALSTGCVYSYTTPESGGSTEQDPTDPPGEYARSCLGRERAFIEGSKRHGTRSVLVRLNYSVELRYGVLIDIAQKVLSGEPVDVTMGYVNVIWQGDAVSHILRSLMLTRSPAEILNVTGPGILSVRELAQGFGRRFGMPATITGTEAPTAWLNNAQRSHELFGPPAMPIEKMMDWIADWLRGGGTTLNKPTHFETRGGEY